MAKEWKTERKVSVLIAVSQLTKDGSHSSVYVGISDSFPLGYFPDYSKERTQPGAFEPQEPPLLTYSWTSPPGPQPATRPRKQALPRGLGAPLSPEQRFTFSHPLQLMQTPSERLHLSPPAWHVQMPVKPQDHAALDKGTLSFWPGPASGALNSKPQDSSSFLLTMA